MSDKLITFNNLSAFKDRLINTETSIIFNSTSITLSTQDNILPTHIELSNSIVLDLIGNKYYGDNDENVSASIVGNRVVIVITGDFSSLNSLTVTNMVWSIIQDPSNFSFDDLPRISDSGDVADFPGSSGGSNITRLIIGAQETNLAFERKFILWFACSKTELYITLNQGFTMLNTQLGSQMLNTNCSSTSDIVANLNILQQIDTTGGTSPDNNVLNYTAIALLSTQEKCFKVTAPYIAEFSTDLNSMELIRSGDANSRFKYIGSQGIADYDFSAVIGQTTVVYTVDIETF